MLPLLAIALAAAVLQVGYWHTHRFVNGKVSGGNTRCRSMRETASRAHDVPRAANAACSRQKRQSVRLALRR